MNDKILIGLLGFSLALGCGGSDEVPPAPTAPVAPTAPTAPTPPAAATASNFGTVTVAPGFTPDPATASGTSGGSTNGQSRNAQCAGWISDTPDHLLVATGDFPTLRVMARATNAEQDITMVIQRPDGSYVCNDDDEEGLNPLVVGPFPAGTYKVWVGSYEEGTHAAYTLGVSELPSVTPSSLGVSVAPNQNRG